MKKSLFILAALFVATFANAQITLEHTFDHEIDFGWGIASLDAAYFGNSDYIIGNYIYEEDEDNGYVHIYDAKDCSLLKTLNKSKEATYYFISRGIFSTDSKWCFVNFKRTEIQGFETDGPAICRYYYTIQVQAEDGTILATLNDQAFCEDYITLAKVGNEYKLVVKKEGKYDYYSLPGNGEIQAVSTPSSPKRSARKIARKGQVMVETENNTYTLTGQEIQ